MSDSDIEDPVPKTLLTVPTEYQSTIPKKSAAQPPQQNVMTTKSQPLFDSINTEMQFRQRIMEKIPFYDGDPETLSDWLRDTGAFFATECVPEVHQVFAMRFILTERALDIFTAHEDLIHNFNDLRKLLLHTAGKAPLRILASLDSVSSLTLSIPQPSANSTQLNTSIPATSITFAQSPDDLTQNEYRKAIITQFQTDKTLKFSGDHKQDVIKWLEKLERKFAIAEITDAKKFDYLTELLDKGALHWFIERKASFNRSWADFVEQFKKVYDSPTRSQLAFQKLQHYHQSADQDIRSFCTTIRRLCKEYDPDMSQKMKLDFLLRSVNTTYRPEIVKLKPTDADEFERIAIEVEHTFLKLKAYELINPSTLTTYTSPSQYNDDRHYQQQPRTTNYTNRQSHNSRSNQRHYSQKTARRPATHQQNQTGFQQSPNSSTLPRQQNLFAHTSTMTESAHQQQQTIPPLMPPSEIPPSPQHHHTSNFSSTSQWCCQWCFQPGHSARDCPF